MSRHCDVCRREYGDMAVRHCPHPAVQRRYGESICVWCCKRCRWHKTDGMTHECVYEGAEDDKQ